MKRTMIQYRVRPERVAENEAAVRAVFEELHRLQPSGLHYATFTMSDGVTFVHVVAVEGPNPLPSLEAFKAFTAGVKDRCDELPVFHELREVGAYRS